MAPWHAHPQTDQRTHNLRQTPTDKSEISNPAIYTHHQVRDLICLFALLLSRVRLFATLWTVACQASLSMEFSKQEYWSGLPFPSPGDLPDPGIEPVSPALEGGFFYHWATREAQRSCMLGKEPETSHRPESLQHITLKRSESLYSGTFLPNRSEVSKQRK